MSEKFFPVVITQKTAGGFEAIIGLELKSLLKGSLFFDKNQTDDAEGSGISANLHKLTVLREGFIQAVSAWPGTIRLELRMTSLPNLQFNARGRVLITLILRTVAQTEIKAKQDVLVKYIVLRGLVQSHMPEAEFTPIEKQDDLMFRMSPFEPAYALTVKRRMEKIQVSVGYKRKLIAGLALNNEPREEVEKGYSLKYLYPWAPSMDDWSRLINVMLCQLDPMQLIVRLQTTKTTRYQQKWMETYIHLCERHLWSGARYQLSLQHQIKPVLNSLIKQQTELSNNVFHVGVFLTCEHPIDQVLGGMVGQAVTVRNTLSSNDIFLNGGYTIAPVDVKKAAISNYYPDKVPYTVSETACAFRLPSPPMQELPGLPIRRSRTLLSLLPDLGQDTEDGVDLCRNIHNGMSQPIRLPADDRMRHTFIIGQTGTGKSTMMESMVSQDILDGHGVAVIDPHGEMVDNILGKIPESRMDDVILFDVLDRQRPLGFNILQWRTLEERDFVIDELYNTIDKIYDMRTTGGPMFESYMRGMLRLLMGSKQSEDYKPTLLEFSNCYIYKGFRRWLVGRNDEKITKDFIKEVEKAGGEAHLDNMSPYVTSKFSRFINDATLVNILGQEESALNFEEIMAQGKILLVKLGKGRFGSSVSALLANQLVAHFKHAAMKRGEMRPEERRDFYLYVDECQNLPASNFTELLSEARKYRMGLVLATQYASQLKSVNQKDDLLSAILGNVGCLTIFRLGQEDARLLAQSLYPYFSTMDIIGLPNWQGYCRLQIRNHAVTPFSFESVMDKTPYDHKVARKVRDLSRQIYGCDVETIKKQIERRQHIWETNEE